MLIRIYQFFNIISLILCIYQHYCSANDVLGCNGFVKSTVGEIDFSKVEIKMFTKQGSLKDQTECAPNNGYYFLPLYDKGEYILKVAPPLGWNFEPAEVTINVDGENDSCSLGIDINFVLQGFAVTGQVASFGNSVGPKGVVVNLWSTSASPEVLLSTTTQVGGAFLLTPVKPGQYNIEISHERWHLAKKRTPVTVKNGNTEVEANSLVVSGYDVSGSVTSDSEPIMGVSFVLFQQAKAKRFPAVGCDSSALTGFSPTGLDLKELIPICHVASDAKGRFIFPSLPSGIYTVVPHYKGMHSIKFDVQPQHLAFKVEHDSLELPMVFQVKGFSVEGRVLWSPGGKPLEGATIMLNQKLVSKTGADGTFYLDSMTPGIYKLLVQAKDVEFKEQNVKVTPNTPHIGDLVPTTYRVCGRVTVSQPGFSPANRQVDLIHSTSEEYYGTISDATGGFCVFVPPAEYTISVRVTEAEHEDGLHFAPLKRKIKVVDSPVSGIDFSQLQATVKGSIKCLTSPCPEILVTLQALSNLWVNELVSVLSKDGHYQLDKVLPGEYTVSVPSEDWCWETSKSRLTVSTEQAIGPTFVQTDGHYQLDKVLPGEYTVSVPSEDWCWETSKSRLTVSTEQVIGPTFVQTGLPINFVSSHATKVKYSLESNGTQASSSTVDLAVGSSRVCVSRPGVYVLEPVGCHGYASPSVRWSGGVVTLTAVSHLYTGRVLSSERVSDLIINVLPSDENSSTPSSVRRLGPLTAGSVSSGDAKIEYTFSTQLAPGETVTLVPAASSLLFTPMSAAVVGGDDCVVGHAGVVFRAERGLIVDGKVLGNSVPVPGASVSIYNAQGQLIATQVTDQEGRYMFGPLSANTNYNVTAEKEGYVLTGPNSKGEFSAHKLAEVIVTVRDKADGQPLQGVLLSLSGGEKYRRNSQTAADGTMAFLSLSPSEYYLRPMMKEYKFDPPSKMIAVQEGATVQVLLSGERVAYSVLGSVTSLSGDPEPGVVVEAVGLGAPQCSQLQEESSSEINGQFRIRGLQPQCEYTVRVKQGSQINQHIQRSTPEGILVKVNKEDVQGLNIIVFRPISRTDITVYVVAESPENLRSLRVKMFRDDTTVHSVRLSSLKATPTFALTSTALVFPPVPADGRVYSIQLESSLSQKTHNYRTHPVYFKANSSFQLVRLNFVTTSQTGDSELSHTSYLALPLVLIALLVLYNREAAQVLLTKLLTATDNTSYSQLDDSSGEAVTVEPVKRKLKQRKT